MPPYQGGGEMILSVEYQKTEFKKAPHRFEAGTPDISGPIGLHAAMDYLDAIGRENIWKHDQELATYAYEKLAALKNIRLFGPKTGRAGLVSFLLKDVHAHDVVTLADQAGVALRGGHHCTQPLMHRLGVESTARASFYFYNTQAEVDRFVEVVKEIQKFFGQRNLTTNHANKRNFEQASPSRRGFALYTIHVIAISLIVQPYGNFFSVVRVVRD